MIALNLDKNTGRVLSAGYLFNGVTMSKCPVVEELPDGNLSDYIFQNGEFLYSPQPTTTEDKTEEEEVTYQ